MERPDQQAHYGESPRDEIIPLVPRDIRSVLDVGCGNGAFGGALRRLLGTDARIVGMEAVPSQAALARDPSRGFDEVYEGYFPDDLPADERFDLITFNDVIEHIVDPWTAVQRTHDHLVPGGRVMASIPNIQHIYTVAQLARGRWDYTDMGTLDRTHVRFFTRATMVELFEGAGFEVETCVGINGQEHRWAQDTVPWRRFLKLRLVPFLGDFRWVQFVIVARSRA